MTDEPARFRDPHFAMTYAGARARVAAMTPEAAKARLLELVGTIPSLVLAPEECRSSVVGYRRGPNDPELG